MALAQTSAASGSLDKALIIADVAHQRLAPVRNSFCYKVYYLCFPLQAAASFAKLWLLSWNRSNIFSYRDRDHGIGKPSSAETWARDLLASWHCAEADGDIVLLTMPRLMGYLFNPVSFWFCLDKARQPRAVIAEVNNTFGDRHVYLCFHDDRRPITKDDELRSRKVFHVSPFFDREGEYRFRFAYGEDKLGVWIDYDKDGIRLLTTSLTGRRIRLSSWALLRCFALYPWVTVKVTALIHYQALKLLWKRMKYRPRPIPTQPTITR